jgi:hypothetical protein
MVYDIQAYVLSVEISVERLTTKNKLQIHQRV